MTQIGKEVQQKMIDLHFKDYLEEHHLKQYLSILEGVCDRKYADELISQAEKNIEEFAKNVESNLQRAENYRRQNEKIKFVPCMEAPEYMKKSSARIFTRWDEESQKTFVASLKNVEKFKKYLDDVKPDSEVNGSMNEDVLCQIRTDIYHPDSEDKIDS